MLGLIALNRVLVKAHWEVRKARKEHKWTQHLQVGTEEHPQPKDAKCPSGNKYGIECPCVDDGPASQLLPSVKANLILAPPMGVSIWLDQAAHHMMDDPLLDPWVVRYGYRYPPKNGPSARLTADDCTYLTPQNQKKPFVYDPMASSTIVVTTKGCWKNHVQGVLALHDSDFVACWGRAIVDEAHKEQGNTSNGVKIFKELGDDTRRWMVTGTPFERSPDQMGGWLTALKQCCLWSGHSIQFHVPEWPRRNEHRKGLEVCKSTSIKVLSLDHKRLTTKKGSSDTKKMDLHVAKLSKVLKTLWLKRDAENSRFFGHALTLVPSNTHE